ncbi:MAG: sensor domain-containing diguanylate cyclase [Anaerolineales bacterium]
MSHDEEHFKTLFDYAPISLWEEDYSELKRMLDNLRAQGVKSLSRYLKKHPEFVNECMSKIIVRDVNQHTLTLFKARSKQELLDNLDKIFRDDMRTHFVNELVAQWHGKLSWSGEGINYTLEGDRLDIILHWRILPGYEDSWERVLVSIENITERKQAERRFESLFELCPIPLWEEDFSALKNYFDALRAQGVTNLEAHIAQHPEIVLHCAERLQVRNVNQKTLSMFGAASKDELLNNLDQVFRDEMSDHFAKELIDMWNGKLTYEREGINYSLTGDPINIQLNLRIMPGHEDDFGWVLVATQDITARKKAEEYLRYLGTHDVMTGLYNRAFFDETLARLEKERKDPISIIMADLNYLKKTNDLLGHQAGDKLIRRAAEVLKSSFSEDQLVARFGGDEFIAVLPGVNEKETAEIIEQIHILIRLNNKYYREPELSLSIGTATSRPGLSLEKVIILADDDMYENKGKHHQRRKDDHQNQK